MAPVPAIALAAPRPVPWHGAAPWLLVAGDEPRSRTALALNRVPRLVGLLVQHPCFGRPGRDPRRCLSEGEPRRPRGGDGAGGCEGNCLDIDRSDNSSNGRSRSVDCTDEYRCNNNGFVGEGSSPVGRTRKVRPNWKHVPMWVAYPDSVYQLDYYDDKIAVTYLIADIPTPVRDFTINEDVNDLVISCGREIIAYNIFSKKKLKIFRSSHGIIRIVYVRQRHILIAVTGTGTVVPIDSNSYKLIPRVNLPGASITHVDVAYDGKDNIIVAAVDRDKDIRIVLISRNFDVYEYKLTVNLGQREKIVSICVLSKNNCVLAGTNKMNFIAVRLPECVIADYFSLNSLLKNVLSYEDKYIENKMNDVEPGANNNKNCDSKEENTCDKSGEEENLHSIPNLLKELTSSHILSFHEFEEERSSGIQEFTETNYLKPSEDRSYAWLNQNGFGRVPICITFIGRKGMLVARLHGNVKEVIYDDNNFIAAIDAAGRLLIGIDKENVHFGRKKAYYRIGMSSMLKQMKDNTFNVKKLIEDNFQILNVQLQATKQEYQDSILKEEKLNLTGFIANIDVHQSTLDLISMSKEEIVDSNVIKINLQHLYSYYETCGRYIDESSYSSIESTTFTLSEEDSYKILKEFRQHIGQLLKDIYYLLENLFKEIDSVQLTKNPKNTKIIRTNNTSELPVIPNGYAVLKISCIEDLYKKVIELKSQNRDLLRKVSTHYEAFIRYEKLIEQLKTKLGQSVGANRHIVPVINVNCGDLEEKEDSKHVRFADDSTPKYDDEG